jgi:IS5 family transposase
MESKDALRQRVHREVQLKSRLRLVIHAAAADSSQLPALLHEPREVIGDQAYRKDTDSQAFMERGMRYHINLRVTTKPLSR